MEVWPYTVYLFIAGYCFTNKEYLFVFRLYVLLIYKCFIKEVVCLRVSDICLIGWRLEKICNLLNAAHRYAFMILLAMASPILLWTTLLSAQLMKNWFWKRKRNTLAHWKANIRHPAYSIGIKATVSVVSNQYINSEALRWG